jgi:hypothetical protein
MSGFFETAQEHEDERPGSMHEVYVSRTSKDVSDLIRLLNSQFPSFAWSSGDVWSGVAIYAQKVKSTKVCSCGAILKNELTEDLIKEFKLDNFLGDLTKETARFLAEEVSGIVESDTGLRRNGLCSSPEHKLVRIKS